MKYYVTNVFAITMYFVLNGAVDIKPDVAHVNSCSKGLKYYYKIGDNYQKGIFMYSAKKVVITADSSGHPIYQISNRNKAVLYLIELTKIACVETVDGTFIVHIDVLEKWRKWFALHCTMKKAYRGDL